MAKDLQASEQQHANGKAMGNPDLELNEVDTTPSIYLSPPRFSLNSSDTEKSPSTLFQQSSESPVQTFPISTYGSLLPPSLKVGHPSKASLKSSQQADAPIQMAKLDAASIFTALGNTTFTQKRVDNAKDPGVAEGSTRTLADILDGHSSAQSRRGGTETMRQRVEAIIAQIRDNFSTGTDDKTANALMIASAIEGVAKIIADQLYDPGLKPIIAEKLIEVYRSELTSEGGFTNQEGNQIPGALDLATVIAGGDPLALYMHEELDRDLAALQIQQMAQKAEVPGAQMFAMLKQKFQAEMASYTRQQISAQEDNKAIYNLKESTGELSESYFVRLFGNNFGGDDHQGAPTSNTDTDSHNLNFSDGTTARLTSLENRVDETFEEDTRAKHTQHLEKVDAADAAVMADRTALVLAHLQRNNGNEIGGLSSEKAGQVVDRLLANLPGLPITLTITGFDWFGKDTKARNLDPRFKPGSSRRNKVSLNALVGKPDADNDQEVDYLGEWQGQAERGAEYLKFRSWKDQKMTSSLGFSDEDLPSFAALNVGFERAQGTEAVTTDYRDKWRKEVAKNLWYKKTERATDKQRALWQQPDFDFGSNYYGDMHLKLRESVKTRAVYTATDHGRPHRNPFLVFADFLLGDSANYEASLTRANSTTLQRPKEANRMLAAALDSEKAITGGLPIEVQIFEGVDLRTDLESVYVAPTVPDFVVSKMKSAFKKKGVTANIVRIAKPTGLEVISNEGAIRTEIRELLAD